MNPIVPPGWPSGYEHWPKDGPLVKVERLDPRPSGPTVWVSISTDRWGEDYRLDGVYATEALALAAITAPPLCIVTISEEPIDHPPAVRGVAALDRALAAATDWIDAERVAAERRTGNADTETVVADADYTDALVCWSAAVQALTVLRARMQAGLPKEDTHSSC